MIYSIFHLKEDTYSMECLVQFKQKIGFDSLTCKYHILLFIVVNGERLEILDQKVKGLYYLSKPCSETSLMLYILKVGFI